GGERWGGARGRGGARGGRGWAAGGAVIARRPADILYDRRLTPFAAELIGEQARQRVGAATRGVGDDDPYQPRGIGVLRAALLGWKEDGKRGERHESDLDPSHRRFAPRIQNPLRLGEPRRC